MKSPKDASNTLLEASQRRVEGLQKAPQDAYPWAHTSGQLSELGEIPEAALVLIPEELVTRNRMTEVWKEGFRKYHGWAILPDGEEKEGSDKELIGMLYYASQLHSTSALPKAWVREILWKVSRVASNLLDSDLDVLALALEEYTRAARKHPGMTLERDGHTDATRLFALVEEIGEVAACLTYDNDAETGHGSDLESEVIQVIALALAWATRYLEEDADE